MDAAKQTQPLSHFEQLKFGREILRAEGEALIGLSGQLHHEFCDAVEMLLRCRGCVVVTGMGKAGLIGQKITATLASTGTPSQFLHPAEAVHGDLGRVKAGDVVLALSYSGESEELVRLLPSFHDFDLSLIAVTGNVQSTLALAAHVVISIGSIREACPHGLAPTTSTCAMLALGDALALVVSRMRNFGPTDFARFHPGGNLGRQLAHVDEVMRPLGECRLAIESQTIRDVLVMASKPGRRSGAIMLTNTAGKLTGIYTDSDLARLLENRREHALDQPIMQVMTRSPSTVSSGALMTQAVSLLVEKKISELPVVDELGKPIGLIDITDVVAWLPTPLQSNQSAQSPDPSRLDEAKSPKTVLFPNRFPRQSRR
jgi:arabinose-5-phosphate isomerase